MSSKRVYRVRRESVVRLVVEMAESGETLFAMDLLRDWLKKRGVDLEVIGCDVKAELRDHAAFLRRMSRIDGD